MKKKIIAALSIALLAAAFLIMCTKPGEIARYAVVTMTSSSEQEKEDIKKLEDELEKQIQKAQEEIEAQNSGESGEGEAASSAETGQEGAEKGSKTGIEEGKQEPGDREVKGGSKRHKISRGQIEEKYRSIVGALRVASYAHINSLIGQAKGEYLSYPEDQREDVKYKIGLKYFKIAKSAEKTCDKKFYSIMEQFESELEGNGYDADIVERAKAQYEAEKKTKREEYLSKMSS
ncbi:hypothetical protein SAMN02745945_02601 [Peptoclostridium litorale DSM 5388]|uniref:Uncharacterized protein n=1 Tax=Peptoclostridium litorale DSM 5388 TaxID=1121324 RepID=A0A069RD34_PEPLI|nr:hypothetical protein [Peptoclostridium litorale]KDR94663.1 hypothetical protein CLIT_14c01240 [Peptoclostridium litorale DSM 5388]SIO30081.1 hypothetical protein SAMN02745945_02601 [Peptoclostridium litorale DSM 5388]